VVGVLIEMRGAILRRSVSGSHGASGSRGRVIGGLLLVVFVTLLAVGTLLAGLAHYHYPGAGAAVVASTVAIAVFGPAISSRRGRDFGTFVLALVITLLSVASGLVPFVAKRLTDGHSPALTAVVKILPSGWGAVAVDAASRSDWGLAGLALGGLVVLTVVLTAASGQTWSWPWVLAGEPTLVIGAAGLLALIGVRSVDGPTPARVLKTNVSVVALPVVILVPAIALLIAGTATHSLALRWLAVPVGLVWGALLCWRSVQLAQQRLESHGPEIFARVRTPAS
jgi:hypothetical protein